MSRVLHARPGRAPASTFFAGLPFLAPHSLNRCRSDISQGANENNEHRVPSDLRGCVHAGHEYSEDKLFTVGGTWTRPCASSIGGSVRAFRPTFTLGTYIVK